MNKFQVAGLTLMPAVAAKPPRIAECLTHIECWIVDTLDTRDQAVDKIRRSPARRRRAQRVVRHAGAASRTGRAQP
jgi:flavin reductase (DIM6/NTAB) family NADH-FMN oxidoreductase RutF